MEPTRRKSKWRDWFQLIRLPNVFTVIADSTAAFLLVAHHVEPLAAYAAMLFAVCCLYWSGMILNDVWDLEVDRRDQPARPLPAGRISPSIASTTAWCLMILGVVIAAMGGWFPEFGNGQSMLPGAVALLLAIMILLYDGPLKRTPLSPIAMGGCRLLSFLLAASLAHAPDRAFPFLASHVIAIAIGFGTYIVGVTTMARGEALGGNRQRLVIGLSISLCGLGIIASAPRWAADGISFVLPPTTGFPTLIGLLACTVLFRSAAAIADPQPRKIQVAIKHAILTLIPLAAAVAYLAAGHVAAIAVFMLVLPAMFLGSFIRVT